TRPVGDLHKSCACGTILRRDHASYSRLPPVLAEDISISDDVHAQPKPVLHLHDRTQLGQQLFRPVLGGAEPDLVVADAAHVVSVAGLEDPNDRLSDDVAGRALDAVVAEGVAAVY